MEERRVLQGFIRDVRPGKGVVRPWMVQEDPVHTRRGQHHGIGGGAVRIREQAPGAVTGQDVPDHGPELVVAHLAQQRRVTAQQLQRQARIGHAAARMHVRRFRLYQLARDEQGRQAFSLLPGRKDRGDIQADMPGRDHFFHTIPISRFMVYISSCSYFISAINLFAYS